MRARAPQPELIQATRMLEGSGPVAHQSLRMACWLLRTVLEQSYGPLVQAHGVQLGKVSGRAAIICLRSLYAETTPDLAADVEAAWTRLSQAVHHQAYELSPTLTEVQELAHAVTRIAEIADSP